MKKTKRILVFVCALMSIIIIAGALTGCSFFDGLFDKEEQEDEAPVTEEQKDYILQYTDDDGTHTIDVTVGQPYSITSIPHRIGYNFIGLFDAQVGGTQFVNEMGSSVSVFTDKRNMVLFPQFEPIKYSVILNYNGAERESGSNFIEVDYDSEISELPCSFRNDKMSFVGWFTEPNGKGVQVTNEYGFLAKKNILNQNTYDISSTEINLYAYFTYDDCTVSIQVPNQGTIIKTVAYNSSLDQLKVAVGDQYIVRFTTDSGRLQEFNDCIMDDLQLYAVLGYKIDLDTQLNQKISSIYACTGEKVLIPIATGRKYDTFLGWEYNGKVYNGYFVMPDENVKLTAKWNSNGWTYISKAEDFLAISNNLAGKYCLANDIVLNNYSPRDAYIWGKSDNTNYTSLPNGFTGILDGQGYTITYSLYFEVNGDNCKKDAGFGLFACAKNATFKNLNIRANIGGREEVTDAVRLYRNYIGSIAGWTVNCTFENINVSGSIRQQHCAQLAGVGGVCGYARNCTFRSCHNSATLSSAGRYVPVAGISASNVSSNYENCSNRGSLSAARGKWLKIGGAWTETRDIYTTRL